MGLFNYLKKLFKINKRPDCVDESWMQLGPGCWFKPEIDSKGEMVSYQAILPRGAQINIIKRESGDQSDKEENSSEKQQDTSSSTQEDTDISIVSYRETVGYFLSGGDPLAEDHVFMVFEFAQAN